jgi:8-oxo-dGTP diphosphatase
MFNIVVNGVIFNEQDQVLIAKRASNDDHEPGMWTTPGGTLESTGEAFSIIEKTLKREIMEEVGIEIDDDLRLIANNTFMKSNGSSVLAIMFLCHYKSGTARPLDETEELAWVTKAELDSYIFPPNVKNYVMSGYTARQKLSEDVPLSSN